MYIFLKNLISAIFLPHCISKCYSSPLHESNAGRTEVFHMYGATRNDPAAPVASPNTIKNAIIVPANSACCGCTCLELTADKFKN